MRGCDEQQQEMFVSYEQIAEMIPSDHVLRAVRAITDAVLESLDLYFEALYAGVGRDSVAPEKLLRALLLKELYGVRSEAMLMEQLRYNLLFRWFVGVEISGRLWEESVFSKNRERLIRGGIFDRFFAAVGERLGVAGCLSDEHFTVDGTLIQAWANRRSFREKPEIPERGSGARGRKMLRDTHESSTDADARLYRRGMGDARPCYLGHVLMENRNGFVVGGCVTQASAMAERVAGLQMIVQAGLKAGSTVGADKGYQYSDFIAGLRGRQIAPHVAEHRESKHWPNYLSDAERCHPGFAISQRKRKRVEQVFGWLKTAARWRQVKLRGRLKVDGSFKLALAAYNLLRAARLAVPA